MLLLILSCVYICISLGMANRLFLHAVHFYVLEDGECTTLCLLLPLSLAFPYWLFFRFLVFFIALLYTQYVKY